MFTIYSKAVRRSVLFLFFAIQSASCLAQQGNTPPVQTNLVRGLRANFSAQPNYALSADPDDPLQLTDNVYSARQSEKASTSSQLLFWAQKTTVGWQQVSPITVGFDLGSKKSIAGVSISTAAGAGQVTWPRSLAVMTSDDGRNWYYAGEVMSMSRKRGLPPTQGYTIHTFVADNLYTSGRYINFIIDVSGLFFFCDEIEVYGSDSNGTAPKGQLIGDLNTAKQFVKDRATYYGMRMRLYRDYYFVLQAVQSSSLSAQTKQSLRLRLQKAETAINNLSVPDPKTFRATIPINQPHAEIFSVYGEVLKSRQLPDIFPWQKSHRYDYLSIFEAPFVAPATPPSVNLRMMASERRAEMFLVTNVSSKMTEASIQIENMPGGANPPWLRVDVIPWTDTAQNEPVALALIEAEYSGNSYRVPLPAGLTRKVLLTVDTNFLAPGRYSGSLLLSADGRVWKIPLTVEVSSIRMHGPRLSLGVWDYTNGKGLYGITSENMADAIRLMRSHHVDTAWASSSALPLPKAEDFDANDNLKQALDFKNFDEWVVRWPDARRYMVFLNSPVNQFAGAVIGTPQFARRLGSWARALSSHMRNLQLDPHQLGLLIIDEPYKDEQDAIIAAWARAINTAAPELTLFSDPRWDQPQKSRWQEAITLMDIVCPNMQRFESGGREVMAYYEARRSAGQTLWFYQAVALSRVTDPELYYRNLAWKAFRYNGSGIMYWSFSDTGGVHSSWNEYTSGHRMIYSPVFLSQTEAVSTLQWEAVREGVQDYEYLAMLRDAMKRTTSQALRQQAEMLLLDQSIENLIQRPLNDWVWKGTTKHGDFDDYRMKVLALLEAIQRESIPTLQLR